MSKKKIQKKVKQEVLATALPDISNPARLLEDLNSLQAIIVQGLNGQFWSVIHYVMQEDKRKLESIMREHGSQMPELQLKIVIELINTTEKLLNLPNELLKRCEQQVEIKPEELDPYFKTIKEVARYESKS